MAAAILAVLIGDLTGCQDEVVVQEGLTGVELTVTHETEVDQLVIDVSEGGDTLSDLPRVPQSPRLLSPEGETVVILLDDSLDGRRVTIRAQGLRRGALVGAGSTGVAVISGVIVPASILLGPAAICGDGLVIGGFEACDDQNSLDDDGCSSQCEVEDGWECSDEPSECRQLCGSVHCEEGQRCVDDRCTCDAESCPQGCCDGDRCRRPSHEYCGLLGEVCSTCNPLRTDECSPAGECSCGAGAACLPGERCYNGMCICDDESCPQGCCSQSGCERRSFELCGVDGDTCVACDPMVANTCTPQGDCQCGSASPCQQGQRCASGVCYCDELSCPDGCCSEGQCLTPSTLACGVGGGPCRICDEEKADGCLVDGTCGCGDEPPCRSGQRCVDGLCICDSESCSEGCCVGSQCVPPSREACGPSAETCLPCDSIRADGCSALGTCTCGTEAECALGQYCDGGTCRCDWRSCEGCCDEENQCQLGLVDDQCGTNGSTCQNCDPEECVGGICSGCITTCAGCCGPTCRDPQEHPFCGVDGNPCVFCDPVRSDSCSVTGECSCVGGPACDVGQECTAGGCVCTDVSCPASCCRDNQCQPRGADACGILGASCVTCPDDRANSCSASGECRCGSFSPSCDEGQRCVGDHCVCDDESCPEGCCNGGLCEALSLAACGAPGATCRACDLERTDGCSATGECQCGAGPACDVGQHCTGGVCLCDGSSCPGCCRDEECLLLWTNESCGSGGAPCEECPETEPCTGGACSGCDDATCAAGCCSGNSCRISAFLSCGVGGSACVACDPLRADRCTGGTCQCGGGSPCNEGQRCQLSSCSCDGESCPLGCCDGVTCRSLSMDRCAPVGVPCQACDSAVSDNCSPSGECRCGSRPACADDLTCRDGRCL